MKVAHRTQSRYTGNKAPSRPIDVQRRCGPRGSLKMTPTAHQWFAGTIGVEVPKRGPPQRPPLEAEPKRGVRQTTWRVGTLTMRGSKTLEWDQQSGSEHHPELVVKETLTFSTNPGRSQGEVLGIDVALYPDAG